MLTENDLRYVWDTTNEEELYFLLYDSKRHSFITYMIKDCNNVTPQYVCNFLNKEFEEYREYKVLRVLPTDEGYPYDDKDVYFEWDMNDVMVRDCDVVIETYTGPEV